MQCSPRSSWGRRWSVCSSEHSKITETFESGKERIMDRRGIYFSMTKMCLIEEGIEKGILIYTGKCLYFISGNCLFCEYCHKKHSETVSLFLFEWKSQDFTIFTSLQTSSPCPASPYLPPPPFSYKLLDLPAIIAAVRLTIYEKH